MNNKQQAQRKQAIEAARAVMELYKDIARLEKEIINNLSGGFETQLELCQVLDLSPQYINDILHERRGISQEMLKSLTKLKVVK